MHSIIWFTVAPVLVSVFALYSWFRGAVARQTEEMRALTDFAGMHFEA